MKQKTTWIHYLIIGISFYCLLFVNSCKTDPPSYLFDVDIIYKNETDHTIKYYQYDSIYNQKVFVFEVLPNSEYRMEDEYGMGGDSRKFDPEIDTQDLFVGFQGRGEILLEFDNEKFLIYKEGEGSTTANLVAYDFKEISDRYYEFTYTFTEEDYDRTLPIE